MMDSVEEMKELRTVKTKSDKEIIQEKIRYLYRLLGPILLSTLILAWALYPERYDWSFEYVSDLGGLESKNEELNNLPSAITMSSGLAIVAIISMVISGIYLSKINVLGKKWSPTKSIFSLLMGIGAGLTAVPTKHPTVGRLHQIGAILFFFTFAVVNMIMQVGRSYSGIKEKKREKNLDYFFDITIAIMVIIALLGLLVFYITDEWLEIDAISSSAEIMQKVVVIVDCLAIYRLDVDDM